MTESKSKPDKTKRFIPPNCIHCYTDGSYRPDGNAACAYLLFSEKTKHVVKAERFVCRGKTINQMELLSISKALDQSGTDYIIIYSDSAYSISCLTLWYKTWEKNNWMTPMGVPVKNKDLIVDILQKMKTKKFVRFVKIKAHSGDPFNSVVDYLVQDLSLKMRDDPKLPDGSYPI